MERIEELNPTYTFLVENFKMLVILVTSMVTAHTPLDNFLHYDWSNWLPFLEVLKTIISILVMSITAWMMYRKNKVKNEDKSEKPQ
jgi:hypothetical protein